MQEISHLVYTNNQFVPNNWFAFVTKLPELTGYFVFTSSRANIGAQSITLERTTIWWGFRIFGILKNNLMTEIILLIFTNTTPRRAFLIHHTLLIVKFLNACSHLQRHQAQLILFNRNNLTFEVFNFVMRISLHLWKNTYFIVHVWGTKASPFGDHLCH